MFSAAAVVAMSMAALVTIAHADSGLAQPTSQRQQQLVHLVRQECGFCHGLRLTGGLGTPLTAEVMKDKPAETMVAVILHGIPGTAMPGWQPFLSEPEAAWIVSKLQEGFPDDRM